MQVFIYLIFHISAGVTRKIPDLITLPYGSATCFQTIYMCLICGGLTKCCICYIKLIIYTHIKMEEQIPRIIL